jgi:hypothetical protein
MRPWRWVFIIALVAGLVWAAWRMTANPAATTTTTASPSSTTTQPVPASTSTSAVAATSTPTSVVVSREEEVKAILENLWFGWFDAIYRKDEDALWKVVATQARHDAGVEAMGMVGLFTTAPTLSGTDVTLNAILLDRADCLVVQHQFDFSGFRGQGAVGETVSVLWPDEHGSWRFATDWQYANDLWQGDCDSLSRKLSP